MSNHPPMYAGFWLRFIATWIDTVLFTLIIAPIFCYFYGNQYFLGHESSHSFLDFMLNFVLPMLATLIFWQYRSATPGKMLLHLAIVDTDTLDKPSLKQFIIRYFSYIISMLPLFLGFLWIAFDPKKQAWHDKIAHTLVIRKYKQGPTYEKK